MLTSTVSTSRALILPALLGLPTHCPSSLLSGGRPDASANAWLDPSAETCLQVCPNLGLPGHREPDSQIPVQSLVAPVSPECLRGRGAHGARLAAALSGPWMSVPLSPVTSVGPRWGKEDLADPDGLCILCQVILCVWPLMLVRAVSGEVAFFLTYFQLL